MQKNKLNLHIYGIHLLNPYKTVVSHLKKLRRELQRKRRIKIELCVKLSLLRLFHVDHVVQNRRTALSLAWYEWFSCKGKESKIYSCELNSVAVRTSNMKISRRRLADYVKTLHQKACRTCSTIIFFSFNQSNH